MKTKSDALLLWVILFVLSFSFSSCWNKDHCFNTYELYLNAYTTDITQPLHVGDTLTYWFHFSDTLVDKREGYELYIPDARFAFVQSLVRLTPEATPIDWEWGAGPEEITIYLSEIGENYILGNGSGIGLGCWNINGYYSAEVKYVFNKAGKYFFYNQILDDIAPNEYDLDCRFENFLWNINVNNGAENNKSFLEIIDNQDVIKAYTGSFHTWGGYCVEVVE